MSVQELSTGDNERHIPLEEMFEESALHTPYDVPIDLLNVGHQMRPEQDFGEMKELTESIAEIGIEQPIRAARWPIETAEDYIAFANQAYPERDPITADELTLCPDGQTCLMVVYGHRRLYGAQLAELEHIPVRISENPNFHDVLKLQVAENLHNKPRPVAFARGLNQIYQLGIEIGEYEGVTDFARHSGVSAERTRDAIRFCLLPQDVQDLVISGDLTYSKAVQVSRLIPAVQEHELLQMRYRRELVVDEMIDRGEIKAEEREHHIGLFEVDAEYLDQRTEAVVREAVAHIKRSRMSVDRAQKYISNEVRRFKGELEVPLLDEAARRQEMLEIHQRRAVTQSTAAIGSIESVIAVATLYGRNMPDVIRGVMSEGRIQRVFMEVARAAGEVADVTTKSRTRELGFVAAEAVDVLVVLDEDTSLSHDQTVAMF